MLWCLQSQSVPEGHSERASASHFLAGWGFSMGTHYHYHSWRVFVIVCALPCTVSLVALRFMPESPRFLLEVSQRPGPKSELALRSQPLRSWSSLAVCDGSLPWIMDCLGRGLRSSPSAGQRGRGPPELLPPLTLFGSRNEALRSRVTFLLGRSVVKLVASGRLAMQDPSSPQGSSRGPERGVPGAFHLAVFCVQWSDVIGLVEGQEDSQALAAPSPSPFVGLLDLSSE